MVFVQTSRFHELTRLLVGFGSENANPKTGADVRVCIVATPLVVRQIQSDGRTQMYRRGPNVHPTLHSLRPVLFLGRILDALGNSRVYGTDRLVCRLPVCLLTLLGLPSIEGHMRERGSVLAIEGTMYLGKLTQ